MNPFLARDQSCGRTMNYLDGSSLAPRGEGAIQSINIRPTQSCRRTIISPRRSDGTIKKLRRSLPIFIITTFWFYARFQHESRMKFWKMKGESAAIFGQVKIADFTSCSSPQPVLMAQPCALFSALLLRQRETRNRKRMRVVCGRTRRTVVAVGPGIGHTVEKSRVSWWYCHDITALMAALPHLIRE